MSSLDVGTSCACAPAADGEAGGISTIVLRGSTQVCVCVCVCLYARARHYFVCVREIVLAFHVCEVCRTFSMTWSARSTTA
jgi:hypothetical protein